MRRAASGGTGRTLIGLDASPEALRRAQSLGVADTLIETDLRDPLATQRAVAAATGGRLADLTVVTTNVAGCEGGAILATRSQGRILFFSMATSFTAAALTAEGVGRDVEMIIGNGYTEGWVETAFGLLPVERRTRRRVQRTLALRERDVQGDDLAALRAKKVI